MHEKGLLGSDILYVHGNSLTDESVRRIADSGGTLVSTPAVELQMQFGYPATTRFLAAGVRPGLGVDVVTSTGPGLFAQMAAAYQAARLQVLEHGTPTIDAHDVLRFATIDGAAALGLEREIGSLTPGKRADILLLRPPPLFAINDPVGYVALAAESSAVDTVLVDGVVRKRAGRLVDRSAEALGVELAACRDRIVARAGFGTPMEALR
jgi:cytosine/adenosine deaminase-related metal-dependent hydrolase